MAKLHRGEQSLMRGQRVTVRIAELTPTGSGVSKELGMPVFIDMVAPGDLAEVELFDVRKDFARGKLVNLLEPSPERAEPPCPLFKVCGGCQWQHLSYEAQLHAKTGIVRQAVQHMGGLDPALVRDTLAAQPLHYRNKVQFPVRNPQNSQRILAGYFKKDSHELVNVKFCPIQPEVLDRMLAVSKEVLERHKIWAYDEGTGKGTLRHINARTSFDSGEVLVTLVINMGADSRDEFNRSPLGKRLTEAADEIMAEEPSIVGVCVNLNTQAGNRILGDQTYLLAGKSSIEECLKSSRDDYPEKLRQGLKFPLSSTSFFQVNSTQAVTLLEVVFDQARELLHGVDQPLIVDAFSGVGAIAFWLSPLAKEIVAIEEHVLAVEDGRRTAQNNKIDNVRFVPGTVESVLPDLLSQGRRPHLIVVDPPRKGLSPTVVQALLESGSNIIYVSCNPSTLARDLKILTGGCGPDQSNGATIGYKTRQIQPVDLFPQTYHVETVTTLERLTTDGSIGNMEEA
ncbi:MAG TPA: 23S rRNA (uracil(1939)-C(5))-methyltransferase RlmD [Planktothrix sp.]